MGLDHVHSRPTQVLSFPEIHHRWKIHVGVDDLVALAGKIKTGCNNCLARGDVLVSGNRSFGRVH
jgi:hypothetical protein